MRIFLLSIFVLCGIVVHGQKISLVSAAPYPVEVSQPDGTKLKIVGVGDEFNHYSVTEDGYTVIKNSDGYYEFAIRSKAGKLDFSGFRAKNPENRNEPEKTFLKGISKYQSPTPSRSILKTASTEDSPDLAFPTTGTRKVLMLLIKYPDLDNTYTTTNFDNMMNQTNYNSTGSFKDYYTAASNGNLTLSVDVFGWYEAKYSYDHYGYKNDFYVSRDLVKEAIAAADAYVDFSDYDNDGDGYVDNLMIVHSGPGAEEGSNEDYIWSHSWYLALPVTLDGVKIYDYIMQPETRTFGMVGIGVFCHEFGHALDLPDLYDTDDSNGDSEGLGNWCLMASGSWLNNERTPAMMSAWARQDLGWISPVTISSDGDYTLSPAATGTQCYKLTTPNSNEYFLLENRYKTGFDASLPGSGLAIYHINSNKSDNDNENNKLSDLEEADGKTDLDDNKNRGDAGDVFPGSSSNTSFNDETNPNALTYDSKATGIDVNTIYLSGSTLHFTLGSTPQGIELTYLSASNNLSINSTTVDVDMEVKNNGSEDAGAFNVAFYLSADASVTTSDYLIGTKSVAGLSSGASSALNLTKDVLTVTPEIPDGTYYLGYIIDYLNSVDESDETNNSYIFTGDQVEIITTPNLTYVSTSNNFSINGYDVSVGLEVENDGTVASDACSIGVYLSANTTLNTSDYRVGTITLSALDVGESETKSFNVNVLEQIPDLPEGQYYVGYIIDYLDVVDETSETDNSYLYLNKKVVHTLYPNLTYVQGSSRLEITASKININLDVLNNGEKLSNTCRVGCYLSDDANVTTGDYLIGYSSIGELAVNASTAEAVSANISSFEGDIDEGMYYVGYIIDYQDSNDELDENDNDFVFTEIFHYCPPDVSEINKIICEGETVYYEGDEYTETGSYEFVYSSYSGCDSVIVLNVTVNPTDNIVLNEEICRGESYKVGQTSYSDSGVYTQTFSNQYGCDSTITLYLNVVEPILVELNEAICEGESVEVANNVYSTSGTYTNVLTRAAGCDSTVVLNLTVNQPSDTLLIESICQGDSVLIGGKAFKTTGVYSEPLTNRFGCDSLVTLDLTVNPSYETVYEDVICEGDTSWVGGVSYIETGEYINSFSTSLGCDSTVILRLTVNPVHDTLLSVTLCEGETIQVGNSTYFETGVYVENLTNQFGCDSIVTLDLIVNPVHETVLDKTICEGDSVVVGTSVYKISGSYTDVLSNQYGCDSTVYLTLTVNPVNFAELYEDICEGTSYTFGGTLYSVGGTYEHTFSNYYGCDSTVTLYLNVVPLPVVDLGNDITMFSSQVLSLNAGSGYSSYLWNNGETTPEITITSAKGLGPGTYSVTVTDEYQCSGSDEIKVTIYDDSKVDGDKEPLLKLFPNPSSGIVKMLMEEVTGKYTVQILSESGALVYINEFTSPGEKFIQSLVLTELRSGYYTVRVISNSGTMVERLVIVKL